MVVPTSENAVREDEDVERRRERADEERGGGDDGAHDRHGADTVLVRQGGRNRA